MLLTNNKEVNRILSSINSRESLTITGLQSQYVNKIIDALSTNNMLESLKFTCLSAAGINITKLLRVCSNLVDLEFCACVFNDNTIKELAHALKTNTSLIRLSLGRSYIGANGVYYISQALFHNNTLITLRLPKENLTRNNISMLKSALKVNHSLESLQDVPSVQRLLMKRDRQ